MPINNPASGAIKSIQSFSISFTGNDATLSATATISSVNTAKSIIVPTGGTNNDAASWAASGSLVGSAFFKYILTNATTVTVSKTSSNPNGATVVTGYVIEYN